jgi:hypothetical protein
MKNVNLNTAILSLLVGLVGFIGKEGYKEIRHIHDDVLKIQSELPKMVTQKDFDIAVQQIKTKQAETDAQIQEIKLQIEQIKRK